MLPALKLATWGIRLKLPTHSISDSAAAHAGGSPIQNGATRDGVKRPLAMLVVSSDESVVNFIAESMSDSWVVEHCADAHRAPSMLGRVEVKIVVIDDESIDESTRGWLFDQVHKRLPHALVAYIAANHSPAGERRARAYNVQYYTSKPLDRERTLKVLRSFAGAAR
jgi:DNA-binding NtrC family response regulator